MFSHENKLLLSASPQVSSPLSNKDELELDSTSNIDNKMVVPALLPLPPPYPLSKQLVRSSSLVKSCVLKWKKTVKRREKEDDPFVIAMRKCSSDVKIDDDTVVSKGNNSLKTLVSCKAPSVRE